MFDLHNKPLKIIEKRNLWYALSWAIILIGVGMMAYRALHSRPVLNWGIDFTGGTSLVFRLDSPPKTSTVKTLQVVRQAVKPFGMEKSVIRMSGNDEISIKAPTLDMGRRGQLVTAIENVVGPVQLLEADLIGPTIGSELRQKSLIIMALVSVALLGYISWRFEFKFGLSALIALLHDAFVTLAFASIVGIEINAPFVAAFLTILGYSINDTIVIFDRIRENVMATKGHHSYTDIANISVNQTFWRSIATSSTTMLCVLSLLLFGGATLREFSMVLLVGILSGTYSSIFIASPAWVSLNRK
ncbi:MAG: protein translocase subunit SecF [Candidatus Margulisiibacteriota bacterium]